MPAKSELKYRPMTTEQAEAAYKKSGPAGLSEQQTRMYTRKAELLERAERIKAKQEQAKINKDKREKKRAKEIEERLKRGLPPIEIGYISPRQTKMVGVLQKNGAVGENIDMSDDIGESEIDTEDQDEDELEYDDEDSSREDLIDSDDRVRRPLTGSSPLRLPSVYIANTSRTVTRASQLLYQTAKKHAHSSSSAFQVDYRSAKRRCLAVHGSSPEVFLDEKEWPPSELSLQLQSNLKSPRIPPSAVVIDFEAKTISSSLADFSDFQYERGGKDLSSAKAMKQTNVDTERLRACHLAHRMIPHEESVSICPEHLSAQRQTSESVKDVAEAFLRELYAENINFEDDEMLSGPSVRNGEGETEIAPYTRLLYRNHQSPNCQVSEIIAISSNVVKEKPADGTHRSPTPKESTACQTVKKSVKVIVDADLGTLQKPQGDFLQRDMKDGVFQGRGTAAKDVQVTGRVASPIGIIAENADEKVLANTKQSQKKDFESAEEDSTIMNEFFSAYMQSDRPTKLAAKMNVVEQVRADVKGGKTTSLNNHIEGNQPAQSLYTEHARQAEGPAAHEQHLSNKQNVTVQASKTKDRIGDAEFGVSKEEEDFKAQILQGDLKPDEKKLAKDPSVLSGGCHISLMPIPTQTTNLDQTQHLTYRRPTTVQMQNGQFSGRPLTTSEEVQLRGQAVPQVNDNYGHRSGGSSVQGHCPIVEAQTALKAAKSASSEHGELQIQQNKFNSACSSSSATASRCRPSMVNEARPGKQFKKLLTEAGRQGETITSTGQSDLQMELSPAILPNGSFSVKQKFQPQSLHKLVHVTPKDHQSRTAPATSGCLPFPPFPAVARPQVAISEKGPSHVSQSKPLEMVIQPLKSIVPNDFHMNTKNQEHFEGAQDISHQVRKTEKKKVSIVQGQENMSSQFDDPQWSTEDWGELLDMVDRNRK